MRKAEIDMMLNRMLDSYPNVSDLNITPGKALQVESSGQLSPVPTDPMIKTLTPFQTEIFALNLIASDRRLTQAWMQQGSCDGSYQLGTRARFRTNIFNARGMTSLVLRKLETKIPTMADIKLPNAFNLMMEEKTGMILVTGAT